MPEFILQPGIARDRSLGKITAYLGTLDSDKGYQVEIKKLSHSRSSQQNRYLNGVAYTLLAQATGYTRDDISEYCCGTYFGWQTVDCPKTPNNPNGTKDIPVRTTTKGEDGKRNVLSWDEFYEYTEFVKSLGAKAGVVIPDPDPYWRNVA